MQEPLGFLLVSFYSSTRSVEAGEVDATISVGMIARHFIIECCLSEVAGDSMSEFVAIPHSRVTTTFFSVSGVLGFEAIEVVAQRAFRFKLTGLDVFSMGVVSRKKYAKEHAPLN